MKSYILFLSMLTFSASAFATTPFEYKCSCVDTGLECDGMENMNVAVKGGYAKISIGSYDWEMNDEYRAKRNEAYSSRNADYRNFSQFKITSGGGGYDFDTAKSSFLLENSLLTGARTGTVKFQSVSGKATGGGFWSWMFKCVKVSG